MVDELVTCECCRKRFPSGELERTSMAMFTVAAGRVGKDFPELRAFIARSRFTEHVCGSCVNDLFAMSKAADKRWWQFWK
jgi:hypothetical protein